MLIDMKEMLSKVMKRAWEIKKQDVRNIFSICLKMAWAESRESEEDKIFKILEAKANAVNGNGWYAYANANLWEKGEHSRMYFSISECRNGKLRHTKQYGYYDRVAKKYVTGVLRGVKQYNVYFCRHPIQRRNDSKYIRRI